MQYNILSRIWKEENEKKNFIKNACNLVCNLLQYIGYRKKELYL